LTGSQRRTQAITFTSRVREENPSPVALLTASSCENAVVCTVTCGAVVRCCSAITCDQSLAVTGGSR
jgi:hypothetical protein